MQGDSEGAVASGAEGMTVPGVEVPLHCRSRVLRSGNWATTFRLEFCGRP